MDDKKRLIVIIIAVILGCIGLFYLGGILGQFMRNYTAWNSSDGLESGASIASLDRNPLACIRQAFTPEGLKGIAGILFAGGALFAYVKLNDKFGGKEHDPRGFTKSKSGAYGTASWMTEKEMKSLLEVTTPGKAEGVILGEYDGNAVCMPKDTRLNRHIAIFGASGTMKSRAIIRNSLFQALKRNESVVITDPKGGATRS